MQTAGLNPAPAAASHGAGAGPDMSALERVTARQPITALQARALLRAGLVEWHVRHGWQATRAGVERLEVIRSVRR